MKSNWIMKHSLLKILSTFILLSPLTLAYAEDSNRVVNPWAIQQSPYSTNGYQQRRPWGETPANRTEDQGNRSQYPQYSNPPDQQGYVYSNPYLYNEPYANPGYGVNPWGGTGADLYPGYGAYPGVVPGYGGYPGLLPGYGGYGYPGLGIPGIGMPGAGYGLPGLGY